MQVEPTVLLTILGLSVGLMLGYFFTQRDYSIVKTIMYSSGVSIGISILIGLIVGGLWGTIFLIVLVILLIIALPIIYFMYSRGLKPEEVINIIAESGIIATTGIPMIALILLIVLSGIFIVTGIIVLFYSIAFFIKFGLPLILGAVIGRILFELMGV